MKAPHDPERSRSVKPVVLSVDAPRATRVAVTGDFIDWDTDGLLLSKDRTGKWRGTFELFPGKYEYRLLIDGGWADHREADTRVPNPFGSENCVLVVD